jgi:UDP-N-acetyl-D-galactosamine dehydrogenase
MGFYVAKNTVKKIIASGKNPRNAKVLILGFTFKENVSDVRNTKVADIVKELMSYSVKVDIVDPHADKKEVEHEYGLKLISKPKNKSYDAVIVAVNHKEYLSLTEKDFEKLLKPKGILVDIKGIYKDKIKKLTYWSL